MNRVGQIIQVIDDELISSGKTYLTLGQTNKLLIEKGIMTIPERTNQFLKKISSEGKIPNAHQTENSPKQWRYTLSEKGIKRRPSKISKKKTKYTNQPKTNNKWIIAILMIIVVYFIATDDSSKSTVKNSPWDNSVYQVERYIKNNLSDPNSFEVIQWSKVRDMTHSQYGYKYKVMVKYRARNNFGGYEVQSNIFFLDKNGNVVDAK